MSYAAKKNQRSSYILEVEGVAPPGRSTLQIQPEETFKPFRFHLHGDLEGLTVTSVKVGAIEQMNHPIGLVGDEICEPPPVPAEMFVRIPFSPVWVKLDTCDKSLAFSVELVNHGEKGVKVGLEIEGDAVP